MRGRSEMVNRERWKGRRKGEMLINRRNKTEEEIQKDGRKELNEMERWKRKRAG